MKNNTFGTKYGILAGVGLVLYFLLFYFFNKDMMLGLGVSWSSFLIVIPLVFLAIKNHRKAQDGFIDFKDGLRTGFLVIILSNLIFYLFFFFILKSDPELVTIFKQKGIDFYKSMMPEDEWRGIEKSYEDFSIGFADAIKYFAKSTIGGFFIALFAAMILKKERSQTEKEALK